MPNHTGPDHHSNTNDDAPTETSIAFDEDPVTENYRVVSTDPEPSERRFTAPGFDANVTTVIPTAPETATEVLQTSGTSPEPKYISRTKTAMPQSIPAKNGPQLRRSSRRGWGWAAALILAVAALAAIAILGTVLFTRGTAQSSTSPEDQVRATIRSFDIAVQNGNLTTLRSVTCGATRDSYLNYDEHSWLEAYRMVSAARQYPVIATIDQVIINGEHAEANVTTFMAYDPQVRSTRSFDLRFLDNRWKICQSPSG